MSRRAARLLPVPALLLLAAAGGALAAGAEKEGEPGKAAAGASTPSFRLDVQPVLTKLGCNSGACHGAAAGKNGFKLSLRGYDSEWDHATLVRQAAGRRVNLRYPGESLMLRKPLGLLQHGGGKKFEAGSREDAILRGWIEAGAPGPRPDDPAVTELVVAPAEAVLAPGAKQAVTVLARYSDKSERDVTPWAKFGTTNEEVATVDDAGLVSVSGRGEAAITAWFSSKIHFARIVSPFPDEVPAEVYAAAPRRNFIDELVLKKLQALRIAPSPPAGDLEFLRRVHLDAAGILPTSRQALAFAADASSEKRAAIVDEVMKRPEFVDYWTYKLSDVLLLNSRKVSGDSLTAFYEFIRKSIAENKPWDLFAREIVTAEGSTLQNGAASYFFIHKDPIDLSETTSQAFLGLSITCARCHNHPLEKWTQDQYYGMANLFARVKLKDGDRPNEVLVLASDFGEVLHPRRGIAMSPQPLDGEPLGLDTPGDRRQHLARWLTAPENPYFARAIVNRVWKNYFGRGIVDPEDDLRFSNPPSNPELLDAVAADFVAHGHDLRHLMRTIMLSATYGRSSQPHLGNAADGVNYSHYVPRRLPAEVILDAYSAVTGVATSFAGYPAGFRALQLRDSQVSSYFLKAFGRPERNTTCACERTESPSLAQALHIANGGTLDEKLRSKDNVIGTFIERKLSDAEVTDQVYLAALTRFPSAAEAEAAARFFAEGRAQDGESPEARRALLEDFLWGVLSNKEFLFNK